MQFSVWHRSDIRQACGVTRWPESPEVKALDGRGNLPRVWPAREASRRAVAKANERVAESHTRMKLICGHLGAAKGLSLRPDGQCRCGRTENRRAVAKANERVAESHTRMKLICGHLGAAKGLSLRPDGQCRCGRTEAHVSGLPAEAEGGNPGKYSSESPEGLGGRQDDP
jgi:hypothetical protein